jgi:hypothetical protein
MLNWSFALWGFYLDFKKEHTFTSLRGLFMYSKTDLEDYVETLYRSIGINHPDHLIMNEVAQRLNIEVIHSEYKSQALRIKNRMIVNLNCNLKSYVDQWEIFGHEIFHVLKDTGNQSLIPVLLRELRESKAKNFALHFCIPTFMLEKIDWKEENTIPFIAERFQVTYAFATERLEQYRNRIIQSQTDDLVAVTEPSASYHIDNCSYETRRIIEQLRIQLNRKGEKLEFKSLL